MLDRQGDVRRKELKDIMGWNGSGQKGATPVQPKVTAKKPSPIRGLIAGGVVVVLAVVAYFAFFSGSEKPQKVEKPKKPSVIKEVKPAPAPVAPTNTPPAIDPKKMPDPHYKQPTNPKLPKKKYIPTIEEVEKARLGPDGKPRKMSIYKTPIEQALGMIFTTKLGSPPPMLPNIPAFTTEEQLNKFLETTFEYDKDAPQAVNENRILMQQVRNEFKNYLKDGGDIKGFVDYYVGELRASYDQWKTAQKMVVDMAREGEDPATIRAFRDKANEMLTAKGIKELAFPPSIRKAMGEEVQPTQKEAK